MRGCDGNGKGNDDDDDDDDEVAYATMTVATTTMTMAAAMATAAALATGMAGPQTTINLSYRNGVGCSWAMAGRRPRNVKGKGDDDGYGDGDGRVRSEEAMPPHLLTPAKRRGGAVMTMMRRALRLVEEECHQRCCRPTGGEDNKDGAR